MAAPVLVVLDDDGEAVGLDADELASLLAVSDGLDRATVSACPQCRSRIVAAVALADLFARRAIVRREPRAARARRRRADTAPLRARPRHARAVIGRGANPGFDEWSDAMSDLVDRPGPR